MIDYDKQLVSVLEGILPTHYEMTLTTKTPMPCISYMEITNNVHMNGDTLGYSNIAYQIKVWGYRLEDINGYAQRIDTALRPLGFRRTAVNELANPSNTIIQKIMTFEALGFEKF